MSKETDWLSLISDWQRSGLSQAEYCRRHSLVKSRFSYWKRKLEGKCISEPEPPTHFVQVLGADSFIELEVRGAKLKFPSDVKAEKIAELVKCLS